MVDLIFHLSDVHIYNHKRHQEYKKVFNNLFSEIKSRFTKNSINVVSGDIVHSKTNMSPELIHMVSYFIRGLCDIGDTFIILGNHDLNLNNKSRLDALTPIIFNLQLKNLYFLKDRGFFEYKDIRIFTTDIRDNLNIPEITSDSFSGKNILIYHGPVGGAKTDTGYILKGNYPSVENLKKFDICLLGDIHKKQDILPTASYPGSLIQQNFKESVDGHGLYIWDVDTLTKKYVEITPSVSYVSAKLKDNQVDFFPHVISNSIYLSIDVVNCTPDYVDSFISNVKKDYQVISTRIISAKNTIQNTEELSRENLRDFEYRNNKIIHYIKENLSDISLDIDLITQYHKEFSKDIISSSEFMGLTWSPLSFEFDNMFSYGEGNYINFENFSEFVGLFAPNASGKSSLIDSILYCIFDKTSKTSSASEVLNVNKCSFFCKFRFLVLGKTYVIERKGVKSSSGSVKVDVNFYIEDTGEDLNGDKRSDTNSIIRSYLGTFENFMLITVYDQRNKVDYVDKTQKDRKELLNSYFDNNVFNIILDNLKVKLKDLKSQFKYLCDNNIEITEVDSQIKKVQQTILEIEEKNKNSKEELQLLNNKIKNLDDEIETLISSKSPLKFLYTEEQIISKIQECSSKLESGKQKLKLEKENKLNLESEIELINEKLSNYDINLLNSKIKDLNVRKNEVSELKYKLVSQTSELSSLESKLNSIESFKYNPDCDICVDNVKKLGDLSEIKVKSEDLKSSIEDIKNTIASFGDLDSKIYSYNADISKYNEILREKDNLVYNLNNIINKGNSLVSSLKQEHSLLKDLEKELDEIRNYKQTIGNNEIIDKKIEELKSTKKFINSKISDISLGGFVDSSSYKEEIRRLEKFKEDYYSFVKRIFNLEVLEKTVSRDGLPLYILNSYLPTIENKVNNIIKDFEDLHIAFQLSDKNVEVYIQKNKGPKYSLSLSSGMERFVSSLAIRVSLYYLTFLPKPDIFFIDEGFGVLDGDNISNIEGFLNTLSSYFKSILIISHSDIIKDYATKELFIQKNGDFSEIISD